MNITMPYLYKYSLVACARWEEADILEWVQYHRSVGFDHIYIYSNDDDPMPSFRVLTPYLFGTDPFVTFLHFPKRGAIKPQQQEIYLHFLSQHKHETEWFGFLDIDEFYVFRNLNNVHTFMAAFEADYDAVSFNWLIYGNAGKLERDTDSVLLSHTLRSRVIDAHTKMLTRSALIDESNVRAKYYAGALGFWHFWNDYDIVGQRMTNVLRADIARYTENFPGPASSYVRTPEVTAAMIDGAYIAHFQFKSEGDFMRRVLRGGSTTNTYWKSILEDGSYRTRLDYGNQVWDVYLAKFWLSQANRAFEMVTEHPVPTPAHPNIALRKPTRQSSIATRGPQDPPGSAVQGHANDGIRTGSFGFATAQEDQPWLTIDLLDSFTIVQIHIYNRMDAPELMARAANLTIAVSIDNVNWTEIHMQDGTTVFGGLPASPLVVPAPAATSARYIKVSSRRPTVLHLDEIEVYGFKE
jgi:hypothetical protein